MMHLFTNEFFSPSYNHVKTGSASFYSKLQKYNFKFQDIWFKP
jgi:hypothetical protein